jgi:hypothetical protein
MGGAGAAGSTTSSGTMATCVGPAECAAKGVPICKTPRCDNGTCTLDPFDQPDGEVKGDALGDCKRWACVNGTLTPFENTNDKPEDGNPCSEDFCIGMTPMHEPAASCSGSPGKCVQNGPTYSCALCMLDSDCGSTMTVCVKNRCVLLSCTNNAPDIGETDVDCGNLCPSCAIGANCENSFDCESKVCMGGMCAPPTCEDATNNGTESDLDCGGIAQANGTVCPRCAVGQKCFVAADCASGVCWGGVCKAPSCLDNVMNGGELGTDCGGTCPFACDNP